MLKDGHKGGAKEVPLASEFRGYNLCLFWMISTPASKNPAAALVDALRNARAKMYVLPRNEIIA